MRPSSLGAFQSGMGVPKDRLESDAQTPFEYSSVFARREQIALSLSCPQSFQGSHAAYDLHTPLALFATLEMSSLCLAKQSEVWPSLSTQDL